MVSISKINPEDHISYIAIHNIFMYYIVIQCIILYYCISRYTIFMSSSSLQQMKPQDLVVLAKLVVLGDVGFTQVSLAQTLYLSQSEISISLARSAYAGLLINDRKDVNRKLFFDFIQYGLGVVFPQKPGPMVRGTLTAHSAPPLSKDIASNEPYVWPYAKGTSLGQSISPLYPTVPQAVMLDSKLYEILALFDAIRVGRTREKKLALAYLKDRLLESA